MNKISDISVISAFLLITLSQTVSAAEYVYIGSFGNAENTKTSYNNKIITNQDAANSDIFNAISTDRNGALNNSYDLSIQAILHNNYSNTGTIFNRRGSLTLNSGSSFYNNYAFSYGGALYGSDKSTINIKGNSQFIGNEAETDGGAIFSYGPLNIDSSDGAIIFKNNMVGTTFNDISTDIGTELPIINISGKNKVEIWGGINNVRQNKDAVINITNGNLDIKTAEIYAQEINFNGNGNLYLTISSSQYAPSLIYGRIFADNINFSNNNNTLNINVDINTYNGAETQTLKIIEGSFNGNFDNLETDGTYNNLSSSDKYTITATSTPGEFLFTKNSPTEEPTKLPQNTISSAWLESGSFTNNSAAYLLATDLLNMDSASQAQAFYSLAPDSANKSTQITTSINQQIISAVEEQINGNFTEGLSAGEHLFHKIRSWVKVLNGNAKLSGKEGFSTNSSGLALGADKQISSSIKLGIGYAYNDTKIKEDFRNTNAITHSALVYGQYKPSDWYLNAIASFNWSDYKESKNIAGNMLRSQYNTQTNILQISGGHEFSHFAPELGFRYIRHHRDAYQDSVAQNVSAQNTSQLTGILGSRFYWKIPFSKNSHLIPELKTALTYDITTPDDDIYVMLENGGAYTIRSNNIERLGLELNGKLKFDLSSDTIFSLGYEGNFKKDYQNHSGIAQLEYYF